MLLFMGQGSQYVGMGKDVYENYDYSNKVFKQVDEALSEYIKDDLKTLGYSSLSNLIFQGTEEHLKVSKYTQPALMTVSIATYLAMVEEYGEKLTELNIHGVAGHSLGEYSALCVAGCLNVKETAVILYKRGLAMTTNCVKDNTGMLAVLGCDIDNINRTIKEINAKCLVVANVNSPSQIVVSGFLDDIKNFEVAIKPYAKRLVLLPVSGAFHSPLMQQAEDDILNNICNLNIKDAKYKIMQDYSSSFSSTGVEIKENLKKQITSPVNWTKMIQNAIDDGFDTFIEVGAKNVLTNLIKKISPDVKAINIETKEDIKTKLFS